LALADVALAARNRERPSSLRRLTKSVLMPVLVAKVNSAAGTETAGLRARTRGGLALSWAGDVALLGRSDAAFATGLGCFAAAHGCYVTAFDSVRAPSPSAAFAPVAAVGTGLGGFLASRAGRLGLPVAGYSAVITAMAARGPRTLGGTLHGSSTLHMGSNPCRVRRYHVHVVTV
jgi:uncharacterized membrane protein YhhN